MTDLIHLEAPRISNVDAECGLLGAVMIENRLIDRAADIISVEDFADPMCGRVWSAILREHDLGHQANPVTIKPYFDEDPSMHDLGGVGWLAQLTGSGAAVIGCLDFARQIAELASRRRFSEQTHFLSRMAEDYEIEVEQLAADAEAAIADLSKVKGESLSIHASAAIEQALNQMYEGAPPGVKCRLIPSLDNVLGALRSGHLTILAGRPAMGKTATALTYAHGAAREGDGVLFNSLEMRAAELGGRLACDVAFEMGAPVPYSRIVDGGSTIEQRRNIARAALEIRELPLWIEDLPSATIGRLASVVRRQARRFRAKGQTLRLVIVDYLQLVRPNHRGKSRYEDVGEVSRGLKALAKAEDVAVLALCQLSRKVEERANKRPVLSDLRDSGDIEQDADTICFLLREEEYLAREEPQLDTPKWDAWRQGLSKVEGKIEFIVAKRRAGRTGTGFGQWLGAHQAVRG